MLLPSAFNHQLMRKRMRIIRNQFTDATGVKVKLRYHDIRFDSLVEAVNFISAHDVILVLYKPDVTYGLSSTKVANASFTTSNGGTLVHGGLVRINDIRYQQAIEGLESRPSYALNYLANVAGHEGLGHLAGLDHINKPKSIMFGGGKFSMLRNLGFSRDDKRGLREVYKK
jgi:predicted Zn-dependent protease